MVSSSSSCSSRVSLAVSWMSSAGMESVTLMLSWVSAPVFLMSMLEVIACPAVMLLPGWKKIS